MPKPKGKSKGKTAIRGLPALQRALQQLGDSIVAGKAATEKEVERLKALVSGAPSGVAESGRLFVDLVDVTGGVTSVNGHLQADLEMAKKIADVYVRLFAAAQGKVTIDQSGQEIDAPFQKFLHDLAELFDYTTGKKQIEIDDLWQHVFSIVKKNNILSQGGVHALNNASRFFREFLGLSEEAVRRQGWDSRRLTEEVRRKMGDELGLLGDLAEAITGNREASGEEVTKALAELKAAKSNGSTVRADDPQLSLLRDVQQKLCGDAKAGRQKVIKRIDELLVAETGLEAAAEEKRVISQDSRDLAVLINVTGLNRPEERDAAMKKLDDWIRAGKEFEEA